MHTSQASDLPAPLPDILSLTKTPIPNDRQPSYGLALHPKSVWLRPLAALARVGVGVVVAGVDGVEVAVEV